MLSQNTPPCNAASGVARHTYLTPRCARLHMPHLGAPCARRTERLPNPSIIPASGLPDGRPHATSVCPPHLAHLPHTTPPTPHPTHHPSAPCSGTGRSFRRPYASAYALGLGSSLPPPLRAAQPPPSLAAPWLRQASPPGSPLPSKQAPVLLEERKHPALNVELSTACKCSVVPQKETNCFMTPEQCSFA